MNHLGNQQNGVCQSTNWSVCVSFNNNSTVMIEIIKRLFIYINHVELVIHINHSHLQKQEIRARPRSRLRNQLIICKKPLPTKFSHHVTSEDCTFSMKLWVRFIWNKKLTQNTIPALFIEHSFCLKHTRETAAHRIILWIASPLFKIVFRLKSIGNLMKIS